MESTQITILVALVGLVTGTLGVFLGAWLAYRFRMKEWEEKRLAEKADWEAKWHREHELKDERGKRLTWDEALRMNDPDLYQEHYSTPPHGCEWEEFYQFTEEYIRAQEEKQAELRTTRNNNIRELGNLIKKSLEVGSGPSSTNNPEKDQSPEEKNE